MPEFDNSLQRSIINIKIKSMDKETKKEFEKLGRMIKRGFDGVDKRFEDIESRLTNMAIELTNLKIGQEEIRKKLTGVVYRFELEELEKRLRRVEARLGLVKRK